MSPSPRSSAAGSGPGRSATTRRAGRCGAGLAAPRRAHGRGRRRRPSGCHRFLRLSDRAPRARPAGTGDWWIWPPRCAGSRPCPRRSSPSLGGARLRRAGGPIWSSSIRPRSAPGPLELRNDLPGDGRRLWSPAPGSARCGSTAKSSSPEAKSPPPVGSGHPGRAGRGQLIAPDICPGQSTRRNHQAAINTRQRNYQCPRCTTSARGRRLGLAIGVSGRSAGNPRASMYGQVWSSGVPSIRRQAS